MKLWHFTPTECVHAILREGLRPDLSRGKRQVVYLVRPEAALKLLLHLAKDRDVRWTKFARLTVTVPASWLKATGTPGRFTVDRLIPPSRITRSSVPSRGRVVRQGPHACEGCIRLSHRPAPVHWVLDPGDGAA